MKLFFKIMMLSVIIGAIAGALATLTVLNLKASQNELIKNFYLTENAVHVSPHSIRNYMDKGDNSFILVDLRSQEEYEKEHIVGAINIPAYKDPSTSAYGDVDRIVGDFSKLPKNKDIVVYCYSMPCMTGRKIGKMLAEHGIYVKHLGIGWNEWMHFWTLWNHELEWNTTRVEDYILEGKQPGIPKNNMDSAVCKIEGEFSC